MSILLFWMFFVLQEDINQLHTYVTVQEKKDVQIDAACEVYPKVLAIGDILYAKITVKNIAQEPLEFVPFSRAYEGRSFMKGAIIKEVSTYYCQGSKGRVSSTFGSVYYPALIRPHGNVPKIKLLSESNYIVGPGPLFIPFPDCYSDDFWKFKNFTNDVCVIFAFGSMVDMCHISVHQELKIKARPESELQLIKEWYDQTKWYSSSIMPEFLWPQDTSLPTPKQWREFEEKLTPGTFRNYIRMIRSLVEIAQQENRGKRKEQFEEMLKWFDELHSLEKEGLTKRAYEIIRQHPSIFGHEISIPKGLFDAEDSFQSAHEIN